MKKNNNERFSEILKNYNFNIKNYQNLYQSNHWLYNNKRKKKLFSLNALKNFRRNGLSEGMDDTYYSKKKGFELYDKIIKDCGEKFVHSLLLKKNIGNPKKYYIKKSFFFTAHELFHIKFIFDLRKKLKLKKKNIICEIGPGYGSMIGKILKLYNSKIILIDLPEANFISHYYLKLQFPKKKFFTSKDIRNGSISKKNIKENDIIIICPWEPLPNIKIDLFINSRSMMEMTYETISMYFKIIHNLTKVGGYFLCINRYYKDTVGYPIEMNSYPYDKFWKVLISKTSWMQDHIHFLLTQRVKSESLEILEELKNIKNKSNIIRKSDPFFFRRNIPPFIYRFYKKTKFFFLSR